MTDRPRQISRASGAWALLAALLMLIASPAHASRIQANASEAIESIRAAVPNADLIVVLDNGSEQRRSDAGRAFTSILTDFGLGQNEGEFTNAWSQLAAMFGVDNGRAFDELFGTRMILVSQDTTITGLGSWAIATVVPKQLGIEVTKKLGAKGREKIVGQTVYAIEGGAYRVSLLSPRNANAPDKNRLLVFSPKDSNDLLSKLLRGLVTPRGWDKVIGEGNPVPPSVNGLLLESGQEVARFEAMLTNTGWNGLAFFELPGFEVRSAGWSDDAFEGLSKGAWLSVADEVDLSTIAEAPIAAILPIDPERLRQLAAHCTGRIYLRISPEEEDDVSLALCLETDGSPEASALTDRAVRDVAGLLTANPDAVPDYQGFMPSAVRTAPIRGDFAHDALRPMIGDTPAIAWRTVPKGKSSWWTTRIAPVASDHAAALDELIASLPAGEVGGPIVSLGVVSPGPVVGLIERGSGSPNSVEPIFARIESASWSTRQSGSRLEVGFDVRMSAKK
ncbi:MAG: hypothetical protein KDA31_09040 [Phycisphaerales bacterium]|nr:hypothetical protein [Phycisphaerales bacterium]MCB9836832.1 hypothetical protein [Phycisphaera sp.]